ncbi:hypothetical protein SAMN04488096_10946 [Mesonia phycicola]|uniref:DUF4374 domain-containing protein n=1 Tax=Mesonia phycicola TaxID=579105 RepID=A0A1M6GZS3_9FLAO|nr:hypothetical protein [Mesonia phycicola]SHJ15469.1 hypothetical protein SAMN04488096_10946 [Mesonia phycicola]
MKTNRLLKTITLNLFLGLTIIFTSCSSDDDAATVVSPENSKYLVSADVDGSGYYTTTDDLLENSISIIGSGYEGYANLGASVDGYFYVFGDGTLEKYEFTDTGMVYQNSISTEALVPGSFYRYIHNTGDGELFLSNFPNEDGDAPYAIIDLETFTVENYGYMTLPQVDGRSALWTQPIVNGDEVYIGTLYGDADWSNIASNLITVKYDYPSLENPVVLQSTASSGSTGGYRTNAAFVTETGTIYQHNLNSSWWHGDSELANNPTVFVKIENGAYDDDYVFDISAEFSEPINIWNAWYAGDNIMYANVIKESDITAWADLSSNIGTLVEINLATETVTELNIPQAPYVNLFKAECIENGKFYIPVSISGGNANIYEITIGGGANAFQKGASLDGSNVYINALYRNF